MEEDTEFTKLPVEDRCVHKLWKARLHGYEECAKNFRLIDDEKSPEWNKFLGLVKKFVSDSNAAAQEKGLEAVLAYVENAAVAGKTTNDVISGIVTKCIAAPKAKTKELAVQIILMYIEIEKQEAVQEELIKGTEAKNPKIVSACISTLTLALREFGPKVMNIKPLMKKIPTLLEDRDKNVRDETKALVVEIYRWLGPSFKQQLSNLKPVQLSELETEFNNLGNDKAVPNRYLRSQKPKVVSNTESNDCEVEDDDEVDDDGSNQPDIDPYDLIDPVDILSKLPKDFYDKLESKKWQERKESLEALDTLVKNPKLENGDYGECTRALKKIVAKDSNVVVVTLAVKCMAGLAGGLKKRFQPYALTCLPAILEKFKEKKQTVVVALRECADAIFLSVNIEQISEDVLAALENKNPSVKAETASFLARCLSRTPPTSLNKKLLKAYTGPLLKTLNEPDPAVRDNSADAIGTALKLVGDKTMSAFLVDVDNLKMTKIKESAEKAVIHVKVAAPKKTPATRPNTAPAKVETTSKNSENDSKPKRPATAAPKKQAIKKPASAGSNAATNKKAPVKLQTEKNYSTEEVDEMAAEMLPKEILSGLVDSNWKNRLAAVEQLTTHVKQMDDVPTQIIVRVLGKKPGFKDTNFQVLKLRIELVKMLAENYKFTSTVCEYCLTDITEKLGDVKNTTTASETLTAIAEVISFEYVANEVMTFAFNQKNPKVQQETLLWISKSLTEFGFTLNAKSLIENVKKAIAATNPGIRTAAISLVGTMYMFMGKPLLTFFENEKPALKQQIEQECEKFEGEVPPAPIRKAKSKKSAKQGQGDEEIEEDVEENSAPAIDLSEMIPRVDISNQLTEALINELSDKNWKVRNEAVQKISNIVTEAKLIKGSLGDLPLALAQRLSDSNIKIAQATLGLCETLATAMGPPIKQYIRALFPGFLQSLGDSKAWMRTAAISCINCWGDQCGYKEFFDGEMIGDALKSGSPIMRNEMWIWLSEKLGGIPPKQIPKEELMVCIPVLYNNLEDRNSDVRKNAQEAVLGFMLHLSYESMVRQTEKLKPGSKNAVIGVLDKVRPNLPVKPLPTKKAPPADDGSSKTVKSGGALQKASKAGIKTKGANAASKPTSARKKDDDVDTSPLLAVNNMKHQRSIDEQKLKILKWNFTTPREEFVDLLKDLMSTANVNKTLMANMFHADFRYHLKAIESLTEDLPTNSKALVSNLDLILKWLTLRFFDTNPSVLLKGLEYLQTVFNFLIEDQYHMLENEASSFIPYLIIKIGDPKDAVRNGVKALFKQIAMVYPVSKLFSYVMEGLKSKNARQRTECLDQLGVLIESYGVSVCQPSPAAALKEVAKQIADRDNSVRNAALNCIVQAYFLEGERVYKLVGQISEKDQSLLDERIKRAAKNRPAKPAPTVKAKAATQASIPTNMKEVDEPNYDDDEPEEEEEEEKMEEENDENKKTPIQVEDGKYLESTFVCNKGTEYESAKLKEDTSSHEKQSKISSLDKIKSNNAVNVPVPQVKPQPIKVQPKVSGPFGLDMELLHKIESSAPVRCRVPKLIEPNLDMGESVELLNSAQPRQIIPISPPKLLQPNSVDNISPSLNMNKEDNLDRTILGMASLDLSVAIMSMNAMETYLKSHHVTMLQSKEDKFINSVNMQLKLLQTYPLHHGNSQVSKGFRNTFMLILTFYDTGILGKNVSTQNLKDLVDQLIGFLAENKLERMSDSEAYVRVINNIVLKIIDNSDHTTIICVLIKLLHERADSKGPIKYEDLIMKCLWKTVKTIPNWAGDLDYDAILLEAHNFFKDYPTSWWKKQKKPDTSMRTIKTVLHSMTQVKGSTILCHLTQINNTNESELRVYLMRLISTFKPDDVTKKGISKSSNNQIQNQNLSVQQQLSEIFKKIGSEQHKREGIAQLYDFKLRHPEADVKPYLEKSHQYFQDYVEQGLKEIDRTRKNQNLMTDQANNRTGNYRLGSTTEGGKSVLEASTLQRLERLRALEAQCQNRS
ncbi:protein mini spindles isoform X1 [Trichogramma pretiosum]|uniref:protein mini spindles isoform X1 n=1 Tax=Trichogramma pretiosum TaxID=7493 RepID=UPI0006C95627|nr:protein mini spindles isoform X1 [Trichogramma pretiosum]